MKGWSIGIIMKVAYFAFLENFGAPNAGFVHTYNIVKEMAEIGIDITLFMKEYEHSDFDMDSDLLRTILVTFPTSRNLMRVNPYTYLKSYNSVRSVVKDVDLIHDRYHVNPNDLLFTDDKPLILEVNGPDMLNYSGIMGGIVSYFTNKKLEKATAIITQTETLKDIISEYYSGNIYVIPNGVDVDLFNPCIKSDIRYLYNIEDGAIVITFVGAFKEWHGVQDIPKIAENVLKVHDDAKFLLVGGGDLFEEMKDKLKGFGNSVILTGPKDYYEIPKLLAASDILIAPFNTIRFNLLEKYGFWWCPIKLFEYMASGKPVVSYDFEEVRRIVQDAGLLAEIGDIDGFTEKINYLIENESLRTSLGQKGRIIAERGYSWRRRAEETINIYKELNISGFPHQPSNP
jgi:glycosyltransferase involved in cell wall biosynthesis